MAAPTIEEFKKAFFDPAAIMEPSERVMRKKLSQYGAFTRRTAKSSIKKAPKADAKTGEIKRGRKAKNADLVDAVSKPGNPPYSHGPGLYKKFIYFGYEAATQTVIIGPALFKSNRGVRVPEITEKGGDTIIIRPGRKPRPAHYEERPAMRLAHEKELPKFMGTLQDSIKPGA